MQRCACLATRFKKERVGGETGTVIVGTSSTCLKYQHGNGDMPQRDQGPHRFARSYYFLPLVPSAPDLLALHVPEQKDHHDETGGVAHGLDANTVRLTADGALGAAAAATAENEDDYQQPQIENEDHL